MTLSSKETEMKRLRFSEELAQIAFSTQERIIQEKKQENPPYGNNLVSKQNVLFWQLQGSRKTGPEALRDQYNCIPKSC